MIPNKLWHTWKSRKLPKSLKSQSDSWAKSNPQLTATLFDDAECSKFILQHFGKDVHELYLALPQPIMRADFWRVAVVYIHGGYYSDLDITCRINVNQLISGTPQAVFTQELDNISNFFFGAKPKHPALKLALDHMIAEAKCVANVDVQSFGMHSLHRAVREYYNVVGTDYVSDDQVFFVNNEKHFQQRTFIHQGASINNHTDSDYVSWRKSTHVMNQERENASDLLFFTTFNKNGYDLYGREWIRSFIAISNYYNKFRAKIYYEDFEPSIEHPSIEWIRYQDAVPDHAQWKQQYLDKTDHSDYVKTMTVRFSHKAFVIQHALAHYNNDYLIWLDGDCVFKNADYTDFPKNILGDKFLACQLEHNHDLNHVESGILIFAGRHPDKIKFNQEFKTWYQVENILPMGQPYDGFLVYKSLLTSDLKYTNLNETHGKGGIQSDPGMTFCHPAIKSKFVHNIGWTGKNQYEKWQQICQRDDVYQKMNAMLFGNNKSKDMQIKKEAAVDKLQKLKRLRA
jgi:mannosyltransferase OCH1-like enzyme